MSSDWDINSYKKEYEVEAHWELKKKFMLAHKDKFSEDELVSLAQIFGNIEFLGCRYPEQTMIRVAELAKGVVEQFREERKNSLKRTFVSASEAASAKMKGQNKVQDFGPPNKKQAIDLVTQNDDSNKTDIVVTLDDNDKNTECFSSKPRIQKYGGVKTFNINLQNEIVQEKPLGNFVLFLTPGDHPVSEIIRSASINSLIPRWDFEEGKDSLKVCKLYFNDNLIATGVGENNKISKENTAVSAIAKLRESYYAVQVKSKFHSDSVVSSSQLNSSQDCSASNEIREDNIGKQLMKLMGWGGGGLGKKEQGIEEPIAANVLQVEKRGLGYNSNNDSNMTQFRSKADEYIKSWMDKDSEQDLVFSTEFTYNERKVIHEIAKKYSLKSRSYGKDANRHLVVSRKIEPWEIVQTLIKIGGSSDKYELLRPTKER